MDAAISPHPADETLRAFGLGRLDDPSAEQVARHLEGCPDCRGKVGGLSADSFLGRVREGRRERSQVDATRSHDGSGSSGPPPAHTLPPGLADHPDYEVLRELGRGGMGVVYLAHNRLMGRDEVLKVMGRELAARPALLDRFLREIRAVARLRHPNIVTAYAATRIGESIVFAMEYVEGLDLSKLVKVKGPMPVAHACLFAQQAALGLQHAFEEGLVHRDIKPGNLMLSRKGDRATVKVLDFGLAKATSEQKLDGALTREGQALGTPDFIAPEQILDAPNADIRADLYSLGGTLFYLLTGRPPFQARSLYDLYQAHISRDADPLNLLRPEVPAELAALVAKMMAKDPSRRFQAPAEVAEALRPFLRKATAPRVSGTEVSRAEPPAFAPPSPAETPAPTQPSTSIRQATLPGQPADAPRPESMWASLVDFREPEPLADPLPTPPPPKRPRRLLIAGGLAGALALGFLALWMGTVRVKTTEGIVVLENLPEDANVLVDGGKITVDWKGIDQPITIRADPGEHRLEITNAAGTILSRSVEFKAPGDQPATVSVRLDDIDSDEPAAYFPLFNGRDLTGWSRAHDLGDWTVERGLLIGTGKGEGPARLETVRSDFRDFRLRLRVLNTNNTFKRIVLRGAINASGVYDGYDVSLAGTNAPNNTPSTLPQGSVSKSADQVPRGHSTWDAPATIDIPTAVGQWHDAEITAIGNRITVSVDGRQVNEYIDPESRFRAGRIALGCNQASTAEFEVVEIQEIKPEGVGSAAGGTGGSNTNVSGAPPSAPPVPPAGATDPGFVPLFAGGKLHVPWTKRGNSGANWKVEDNLIVGYTGTGGGDRRMHLEGTYQDFVVRAEVMREDGAEAVIFFREALQGDRPHGYSVGLGGGGWVYTPGSFWQFGYMSKGSKLVARPTGEFEGPPAGEWFTVEVEVINNRIAVRIDGELILEAEDPDYRYQEGRIGFWAHGEGALNVRKVEVKSLSDVHRPAGSTGGSPTRMSGASVSASVGEPPMAPAVNYQPLFNGRDLTGWTTDDHHKGDVRVRNGVLTLSGAEGVGQGPGSLRTERADFSDFRLRIAALNVDGKSKHVLIRRSRPGASTINGYGVSVGGTLRSDKTTLPIGSIWKADGYQIGSQIPHEVHASPVEVPIGTWHLLEIVAKGNTITSYVNGQRVAEYTDRGSPSFPSGEIAIQSQSTASIQYKEIAIAELPPEGGMMGMMDMDLGGYSSMMGGGMMGMDSDPPAGMMGMMMGAEPDLARVGFETNLIRNADAEDSSLVNPGEEDGVAEFEGWDRVGNVFRNLYKNHPTEFNEPSLEEFGNAYFFGGTGRQSSLAQAIDLGGLAEEIDSGRVRYSLGGWLGAARQVASGNDTGRVTAQFLDSEGTVLEAGSLESPSDDELEQIGVPINPGHACQCVRREYEGIVPAGTRTVRITVNFTLQTGKFSNVMVDNLSLVLHKDNPASMMGLGPDAAGMMGMMGGEPTGLTGAESGMMGMGAPMMGMMGMESPGAESDGGSAQEGEGLGSGIASGPRPGDALVPGTTWLGTRSYRDPTYPDAQGRCTLKITARRGQKFAGTLIYQESHGSRHQIRVEGAINDQGTRISFLETGEGQYRVQGSGGFDGDAIDYEFRGTGIGGKVRYGAGRMTRQ